MYIWSRRTDSGPNRNNLFSTRQIRERYQNVLVWFPKRYRNVCPFVFYITSFICSKVLLVMPRLSSPSRCALLSSLKCALSIRRSLRWLMFLHITVFNLFHQCFILICTNIFTLLNVALSQTSLISEGHIGAWWMINPKSQNNISIRNTLYCKNLINFIYGQYWPWDANVKY